MYVKGRTAAGVSDSIASMRRLLAALAVLVVWVSACGGSEEEETPERPPSGGSPLQQEGRYSYATSGFERLSAVLSSRHRYPRRSTVDVEGDGCGYSELWKAGPERMSRWDFCTDGRRWRLAGLFDYHEFFGQATIQRFRCRGPLVPRAPSVRIGLRWTDRCRGAGSRVTVRYVAVRNQTLRVAGKPVETVLIRARARLRGRIDGQNVYDSWLSRSKGLLIRREVRSDTAIDTPFGKARDRERYSLELRSLVPG
jgi:hypothetical protein